jgi:hypothetical protein
MAWFGTSGVGTLSCCRESQSVLAGPADSTPLHDILLLDRAMLHFTSDSFKIHVNIIILFIFGLQRAKLQRRYELEIFELQIRYAFVILNSRHTAKFEFFGTSRFNNSERLGNVIHL